MSGIGSSDQYNTYRGRVDEIEEQHAQALARLKKKQKEQIAKLERNFDSSVSDQKEDAEKAILDQREKTREALAYERESHARDLKQLESQTYNQYGRFSHTEKDLKDSLHQIRDEMELHKDAASQRLYDQREDYENRMEEIHERYGKKMEELAEDSAEKIREASLQSKNNSDAPHSEGKAAFEKKLRDLNLSYQKELQFEKKRMQDAITQSAQQAERRVSKTENVAEERMKESRKAANQKLTSTIESLRGNHDREINQLRDQVNELSAAQGNLSKEKFKARQEALREVEQEFQERTELVEDAYQRQISDLKLNSKGIEDHFGRLKDRAILEKERHFSELISKETQDSHSRVSDLAFGFEKDRDQLELRHRKDREQAREDVKNLLKEGEENRLEALNHQSGKYRERIDDLRKTNDHTIKELKKELHNKKVTDDVSEISPAAEQAVRNAVIKEYEKSLSANKERTTRALEGLQDRYGSRIRETKRELGQQATRTKKDMMEDHQAKTNKLMQHVAEVQSNKELTVTELSKSHERELEQTVRNYNEMLVKQRYQNEENTRVALNEMRDQMNAMRQEYEFDSKMSRRAFAQEQNGLIRDYEKKFADQKTQYETLISETKQEAERQVRENERRFKQELEQQARNFEHRIEQMEFQHGERERFISQRYEDQLDKLKRSNALLITKKS